MYLLVEVGREATHKDARALEHRPVRDSFGPELVDARPERLGVTGLCRLAEHAEKHLGKPIVGQLRGEGGVEGKREVRNLSVSNRGKGEGMERRD